MSIVYTSKINSLVINPTYKDASGNEFPYTILKVKWTYTATLNEYTTSIYPETILKEPTTTDFTDYNSLTETEILNWVFSTDICISSYQKYLNSKLDELSNNIITISWSSTDSTGTTGTT